MPLKLIRSELGKLPRKKCTFEPDMEVGPEDHIVGIIEDPDLRKLYQLLEHYHDSMAEIQHAHNTTEHDEAEFEERSREYKSLYMKYSVMGGLFWLVVCQEFPELSGKPGLAICKDWHVVWGPTEEGGAESFLNFFFLEIPEGAFEPVRPEDSEDIEKQTVH